MEKLPELDDKEYCVEHFSQIPGQDHPGRNYVLEVKCEKLKVEDIEGWLEEYQVLNQMTLKLRTKKKPTSGYLLYNYYR